MAYFRCSSGGGGGNNVATGTFTPSATGRSVNLPFTPKRILCIVTNDSGAYSFDYWEKDVYNTSIGTRGTSTNTGGTQTGYLTVSGNTFTHKAYNSTWATYSGKYLATD